MGLHPALLRALHDLAYRDPTPVQTQAMPPMLAGRDVVGIARTGTGKTAAFALPILQLLVASGGVVRPGHPRALILSPTRELAVQIDVEMKQLGQYLAVSCAAVYGGAGQGTQVRRLQEGVHVLVATPGRLLDLMGQGHISISEVAVLVLDEADRLLDMGFLPDVRRVVRKLPVQRQTALFSATLPDAVADLAGRILRKPVRVDVSPGQVTVKGIRQRAIMVERKEKRWVLEHLLHDRAVTRAIVFTRTRKRAEEVTRDLLAGGISAECLHGERSQRLRQRALENFRNGVSWVLVATDVAARGIHVEGVSHVINYDLPDDGDSYIHRIGRTARLEAGKGKVRRQAPKGVAWTLCEPAEVPRLRAIERRAGRIPTEEEDARAREGRGRPSGKGRRRR